MGGTAVRFAVVDPASGKHCGGWRIWTSRNDVYMAPLQLGATLKLSLHQRIWRLAFTSEHWASGDPPSNAPGPGRRIWEIEHIPPVVEGVQHAWYVQVLDEALVATQPLKANVVRIPQPSDDRVVQANVWLCDPEVSRRPEHPVPPSPLTLEDGRSLWVGIDLARCVPADESRTRPIVGNAVGFAFPERPGETPGFVVKPVDVEWGDVT